MEIGLNVENLLFMGGKLDLIGAKLDSIGGKLV